jgi:hypothetical protein
MICSRSPNVWRTVCLGILLFASIRASAADDTQASKPVDNASVPAVDLATSADEVRTAATTEVPTQHPLFPPIQLAKKSLQAMESLTDYEATFVKEERVNGNLVTQTMQIRLRESPFSVYLLYGGDDAGREILYVQGQNNNQLHAHEGRGLKSLVGTVSLAADGVEALQGNRYPITQIGMRRMLETVLTQWQQETLYGEIDVRFYPDARLGGRPCQVIESTHPHPRRQFKFHLTRLFIDSESKLPVRVEQYGFPLRPGGTPVLEELYSYSNIRANVGLTDRDFSTKNSQYSF